MALANPGHCGAQQPCAFLLPCPVVGMGMGTPSWGGGGGHTRVTGRPSRTRDWAGSGPRCWLQAGTDPVSLPACILTQLSSPHPCPRHPPAQLHHPLPAEKFGGTGRDATRKMGPQPGDTDPTVSPCASSRAPGRLSPAHSLHL